MNDQEKIRIKVFRFTANEDKEPRYETYEVPLIRGRSIFNVLQYINENYDGGLAHYVSCRVGLCTGCVMRVNGKPKMACTTLAHEDMTIEPISEDRVVKDLICFSKNKSA